MSGAEGRAPPFSLIRNACGARGSQLFQQPAALPAHNADTTTCPAPVHKPSTLQASRTDSSSSSSSSRRNRCPDIQRRCITQHPPGLQRRPVRTAEAAHARGLEEVQELFVAPQARTRGLPPGMPQARTRNPGFASRYAATGHTTCLMQAVALTMPCLMARSPGDMAVGCHACRCRSGCCTLYCCQPHGPWG